MIWRNYVTVTLCIQDQKSGHWLCGHNCIIRFSLHWQMSNRQQLQWMRRLRSSKTQRTRCGMSAVGTLPRRHRWSLELHPLCSRDLQSYTSTILMHILQFSRLPPTVYPHLLQKRTYQDNFGRFHYRHDAISDTKPTASKHWENSKHWRRQGRNHWLASSLPDPTTSCLKNVPPLACYNLDTCKRILTFFGRNATDKVSNQKALYYATSNNVCFCIKWQKRKHKNCIFTCCISALSEFNQSLLDFFNLFDSWLILTLLYDSLNHVIDAFRLGFWGAWFTRKEVKSAATVGFCCTHKTPVRCLLGFLFCKVMLKH